MTFHDMCAQMGITENDLYNNEDNTQEEAESRIHTENVAEELLMTKEM